MAEFTEADVIRHLHAVIRDGMEAVRLTSEYVQPTVNLLAIEGWSWFDWIVRASAAMGEDVPPWAAPPDHADVMAEHIWCGVLFGGAEWLPDETTAQANLIAALRDLFPPEALAAAAAKVQEGSR